MVGVQICSNIHENEKQKGSSNPKKHIDIHDGENKKNGA